MNTSPTIACDIQSKKNNLHVHIERCKVCERCIVTCTQHAITLSRNITESGYEFATADDKLCSITNCAWACSDELVTANKSLLHAAQNRRAGFNYEEEVNKLISLL